MVPLLNLITLVFPRSERFYESEYRGLILADTKEPKEEGRKRKRKKKGEEESE